MLKLPESKSDVQILFRVGIPLEFNFTQLTNGRIASQRTVKIMPEKEITF